MKKIEIDTFLQFQFVSNPLFSPDGANAAFLVTVPDREQNTYHGDLYVYSLETKKLLRLTNGRDVKTYAWSSDTTILFAAAPSPGSSAFYEISICGGEACRAFSIPETVASIRRISKDRYLLMIPFDNYKSTRKASYEVIDELPFWSNGRGFTNARRNRAAIYDRALGKLTWAVDEWTDCTACSVWGDLLLYQAYRWKQGVLGAKPGVYLYNMTTQETKIMIAPNTMRTDMIEMINETTAIVTALPPSDREFNEYCDFYRLELSDGTLSLLAPYDACVGSSAGTDSKYGSGQSHKAENGVFYFLSTIGDFSHLYKLSMDGSISGPLTAGSACDSFDIQNGHIASCEFRGLSLAELFIDGEQVTHFNDWLEKEYSCSVPEAFSYTGTDGYEIHGWVMKPTDWKEGYTYPAILNIHGGPRSAFSDIYYHEMQVWANAGYFVFFCNPRGSDGRGADFGDVDGIYGTVDYDNLMEFTDEVLKRYPEIDENRVGVTGGSYGGFMTNWIVGHTDRFAAAASQRSIANWISYEHSSDIGHTFVLKDLGGNTRTVPELLWKQSPLQYAPACKTPILFIHSDQDYRCYMAEGLAMFSAVKRNGCPAKMCLFHGENHELSRSGKPENRIDRMAEILNWMDTYLK